MFGGRRLSAYGGCLNTHLVTESLLDSNLLTESLEWILTLQLLELLRRVLVQELIDGEETTSNLDVDLFTVDLNHDTT